MWRDAQWFRSDCLDHEALTSLMPQSRMFSLTTGASGINLSDRRQSCRKPEQLCSYTVRGKSSPSSAPMTPASGAAGADQRQKSVRLTCLHSQRQWNRRFGRSGSRATRWAQAAHALLLLAQREPPCVSGRAPRAMGIRLCAACPRTTRLFRRLTCCRAASCK